MIKNLLHLFARRKSNIFHPKDPQTKLIASRSKVPFLRKLTIDLIANAEDDELDRLIAYNIFAILQENKALGNVCVNRKLSAEQKAFYITRAVEADIHNGGFNQLFFNSPDLELPKSSLSAFDKINAREFTEIISEALNLFIDQFAQQKKEDRTLENLSKQYDDNIFTSLDEKFYEVNGISQFHVKTKLDGLRLMFVKENMRAFT